MTHSYFDWFIVYILYIYWLIQTTFWVIQRVVILISGIVPMMIHHVVQRHMLCVTMRQRLSLAIRTLSRFLIVLQSLNDLACDRCKVERSGLSRTSAASFALYLHGCSLYLPSGLSVLWYSLVLPTLCIQSSMESYFNSSPALLQFLTSEQCSLIRYL